jgi:4-hydroxybenzoate polyprenyltransferase
LLAFVSYSLLMGAVFIVNQMTDVSSDLENEKLFLIAEKHVSPKAAVREISVLVILSYGLALKLSGWFLVSLSLALLVLGVAYSLPPFLWKDHPFLGLFANLFGGFVTFSAGWLAAGDLSWKMVGHALPYIFAVGAVYFLTTILDAEGDLHSNKITVAVRFGDRLCVRMALFFDGLALALGVVLRDWIVSISALVSLFLFGWLIFRNDPVWINRATRLPILVLSVLVAVYFPPYWLGILGIYFLSKWYYWKRFGLNYPSLSPTRSKEEA